MNNFIERVFSSIILIPLIFYIIIYGSYILIIFTLVLFTISSYEWHKMTKNRYYKIYGLFFLIFSFYSFYTLSFNSDLVLFIILICISSDVGGYFFGKIFKGPKLTKISPKKTYSGMLGSYFLSLISLILVVNFMNYPQTLSQLLVIVFIISTISQIGDIFISYFKRISNIKDTGKIIPGHGGLLDRIDGMIFVFPIILLFKLLNIFNL
jgi:phosphatidate cytidylyltransferase